MSASTSNHLLEAHQNDARTAFNKLWKNKLSTAITCLAIGITLALPTLLYTLAQNFNSLSYSWESTRQASLFLRDTVSTEEGQGLAERLKTYPGVESARYISRAQSLQDFKSVSGFGAVLDLLTENPLPAVIVVMPSKQATNDEINALVNEFAQLPAVEVAKLDKQWLERLQAISALISRLIFILAVLLSFAVMVIVGNMIRLDIEARRSEIEVMKLIGADNAFIRRPFLYTGMWYGLVGGLLCCILVSIMIYSLAPQTHTLADLYRSNFQLHNMSFGTVLLVFIASISFGLLGAWWSVNSRMQEIEPK